MNPLDNPVWHALNGPLSRFAESGAGGQGLRFDPEVSVFAGADRIDSSVWEAQARMAGAGEPVIWLRDRIPSVPEGWRELFRIPTFQMVAGDLSPFPDVDLVTLGERDVSDMLGLTRLTEPGPFLSRTHELGCYKGVRQGGQLVAMAGERLRVRGWTEISAVCTHPSVRRRGLGAILTLWLAHRIRGRGEEAFLHVVKSNEGAVRLYRSIGFKLRCTVEVVVAVEDHDGTSERIEDIE